ncbi:MAG: IPTL-CTERM sorting domain-containing protein [Ottowia sp.]|uniref:IPTL-CTERM sorting domain-containing protein n=1 Tax=Ottowia sp. TaxID=1898956 RepID=UPI0039E53169
MTTRHIAAALLACAAATAQAAPFAITYNGTIGTSSLPEIHSGQPYSITLVLDNGDTSASDQSWNGAHITCVIWRMNTAQNVVLAQNGPITNTANTASTNMSGTLTGFFDYVVANPVAAGSYTTSGFTSPLGDPAWFINGDNAVFSSNTLDHFDDASGGVPTTPASWSNPVPFTGSCAAPTAPTAPNATPVPTLGHAALALLAGLLGAAGFITRRKA